MSEDKKAWFYENEVQEERLRMPVTLRANQGWIWVSLENEGKPTETMKVKKSELEARAIGKPIMSSTTTPTKHQMGKSWRMSQSMACSYWISKMTKGNFDSLMINLESY